MNDNTEKQIRPTVRLSEEEHKKISHYCIDNSYTVADFLRQAALYCVDKKVKFDTGKE